MSYDIRLKDKKTNKTIELNEPHQIKGGTYCLGGTTECWLNITYNYSPFFYKIFGKKGIRIIYGKIAKKSIPILEKAIGKLKDDINNDYWKPTEGNAKEALKGLLELAKIAPPNAIWSGD